MCSSDLMIHCEDRFVVVKILNCLFINVYLLTSGKPDRQAICENLLEDLYVFGAIVIMTVNALLVAILM